MFRIMSIATLVMIVICFFIGASLAIADDRPVLPEQDVEQINDASRPAETSFIENLAQNDRQGDIYDFSDYFSQPDAVGSQPKVDSEQIEEPEIKRFEKMDC